MRGLPPRVRVMRRIILCRAMPRSTTELGLSRDMASYMSLSINQKAMVLSPTKACKPELRLLDTCAKLEMQSLMHSFQHMSSARARYMQS